MWGLRSTKYGKKVKYDNIDRVDRNENIWQNFRDGGSNI